MPRFDYHLTSAERPRLGLIVLQADERIESDFRRLIPADTDLFVSRIASGREVTPDTLAEMEARLPASAALLPQARAFDAIGYACTSGAAQIGPAAVAAKLRRGAETRAVTEPVSALVAACAALGLTRLAILSPYVAAVSERLRAVLAGQGVETPVFGSFEESEEARVARFAPESIRAAAVDLARTGGVDGLFLSCTNLDTLDIIAPLEAETGLPVLSSNLVLAWHLSRLAGVALRDLPAGARLAKACRIPA